MQIMNFLKTHEILKQLHFVKKDLSHKIVCYRETENDDLTSVMQKIVCTYTEQELYKQNNKKYLKYL